MRIKKTFVLLAVVILVFSSAGCLGRPSVHDSDNKKTDVEAATVLASEYDWEPRNGETSQDIIDRIRAEIDADLTSGKRIVVNFSGLKNSSEEVYDFCRWCLVYAVGAPDLKDPYSVEGAEEISELLEKSDWKYVIEDGQIVYKRQHTDEELEDLIEEQTAFHIATVSILQFDSESDTLTADPSALELMTKWTDKYCPYPDEMNPEFRQDRLFYSYKVVNLIETIAACARFGSECEIQWPPAERNVMLYVPIALRLTDNENDVGEILSPYFT